jgi:hypothetical protein
MADAAIQDLAKVAKVSWTGRLAWSGLALAALIPAVLLYRNVHVPARAPVGKQVSLPAESKETVLGGVKLLQEMLRSAGHYTGPSTDRFDAKTEDAVKRFQVSEGLKADGKPGAKTLARLYQKSGGTFVRYTAAKESKPPGGGR